MRFLSKTKLEIFVYSARLDVDPVARPRFVQNHAAAPAALNALPIRDLDLLAAVGANVLDHWKFWLTLTRSVRLVVSDG